MDKISQIKQAIQNALERKSNLTDEAIDSVGGFTSPNTRHLYNNLGAISTHVLEIGSHKGSTFISSVYGNSNLKSATSVDNFSEFNNDGTTKQELLSNCERLIKGQYTFLDKNCWKLTKKDIPNKIDFYNYDGGHSYEEQRDALIVIKPLLADICIVTIDDYSWFDVKRGTRDGIRLGGFTVLYEQHLFSGREGDCGSFGWWNGVGIFLLKKI